MDKKNTLLLTVIAIATLLVAVVGATFAYFTAQNGNTVTANMQVTTSTTNTATISEFQDLVINANQLNFANMGIEENASKEYVGSQKGETSGSIGFTASTASANQEEYCYTVDLKIAYNTFQYTLPQTFSDGTGEPATYDKNYPELVFNISKAAGDATPANPSPDYVSYGAAEVPDVLGSLKYYSSILPSARVCLNDARPNTVEPSFTNEHASTYYAYSCQDGQLINGYDITTDKTPTINIPVLSENNQGNTNLVHKIIAPKGTTVTDYWKASITFVNYKDTDINQAGGAEKYAEGSGVANQNANAGQNGESQGFRAQLVFTPVDCNNGTPLNQEP